MKLLYMINNRPKPILAPRGLFPLAVFKLPYNPGFLIDRFPGFIEIVHRR
jgi:hypothetical protein